MADWPLRINITEESLWKNYDFASSGGISEWASDNAHDDLRNIRGHDCAEYMDDLIQAFIPKSKRKKISSEDLDRLCEAFMDDMGDFESIEYALRDAFTWAWEIAYMPDDGDIETAIKRAKERWDEEIQLADYWDLILSDEAKPGPKEWSPRPRITERQLFDQLEERINYQRKPGHYDRFIEFDFMDAPAVREMKRALKSHPEDGSVDGLLSELEDLARNFLGYLDGALDQVMENSDPHSRWDFRPHWKGVLADKSRKKGIEEEILGFLAKPALSE